MVMACLLQLLLLISRCPVEGVYIGLENMSRFEKIMENNNGLVTDQALTAMAHLLEFNSNYKLRIVILTRDWLIRS